MHFPSGVVVLGASATGPEADVKQEGYCYDYIMWTQAFTNAKGRR